MANLLQQAGAQPNKDAKFVPLFMDRAFTGLYTQRSPLRDPSDWVTSKFYGGRPDALIDGLNVELTNRLTLQRRPGLSPFSTATYPTPPNRAFDFELTDGTIQVIIDTGYSNTLAVTHVSDTNGTTADYTGTFPDGGSNAYVGMKFTIAGFAGAQNNGTFTVVTSTTTTLTLANTAAVAETLAATAITSGAVYYDRQDGTKVLLFGKIAGAVQTHFVAVAGVLYMGDGVEVKKYTPGNPNGTIWNWGIATPTVAPSVNVVNAGAASVVWQLNTFFSTMGLLVDSNDNIQQLVSTNADGSNPHAVFGLSSAGGPTWNHSIGGTTTDGSITWRNIGTLNEWQATTTYANWTYAVNNNQSISTSIFDTNSNSVYVMTSLTNLNPTGIVKPNFTGVAGQDYPNLVNVFQPNKSAWRCTGAGLMPSWTPGTPHSFGQMVTEYPMPPLPAQVSYLHVCITAGTSASTFTHPSWATAVGESAFDNQLQWVNLGSKNWAASTTYTAWVDALAPFFSAVVDTNGNFQVCIANGISGGSNPSWGVDYGTQTHDGTVTWVCVGPAGNSTWSGGKFYALPFVGFSPPTASNPYGGAAVKDSNGNIQYTVVSGLSGGSEPVWDVTTGELTFDNQVTWFNNGPVLARSLSWSTSLAYVYSFKSRATNDPYQTVAPPLWPNPLGAYKGSGTGAISSASPQVSLGSNPAGAVVTVTLTGSLDLQVDTLEVYRTTDGGATFIFLTDVPNPTPIGGNPGVVSFQDYMPDTASGLLPGLNPLIPAPVNNVNDPPSNAFLPMAYNFQRIWGSVGSSIFFSGGPDTLVGNPNEAFDAADKFPYLATVVRAVKTTRGLVVFLINSVELIAGGPQTASFFSVTLAPGIGLRSFNALDVYGGEIFFFSADGQFKVMSPELQLANFGFPIGDQFANASAVSHVNNWSADRVYVAVLQSGLDSAIFVADGSTGWFRLNPRQVPGGFSGPEPIWSPFAAITNGCKMVQTVETTPGIRKLLVGSDDPSRNIWQRDLNVFTDIGTPYDAYFVMGSIMMANPGQIAVLKFIEADFSGVAFRPTVSFLLNEIAGTFTSFTQIPTFDPPQIYGQTITPGSYSPNRYYFSGEEALARCRHMQIKIDFGETDDGDELYNLTIFGRLVVEP